MEQHPETPSPVVLGAGTDPTHIPGLGALQTDEPETTIEEPSQPAPDAADAKEPEAADNDDGEAEEEAPPEGPEFEVSDRRGSILANSHGVTFRLDDTEARFPWREIGSVEIGASRFGRRFEVAVCTRDRRRFDADVEASSRRQLDEWTTDLDAVLDTWFDDGR